MELPVRQVHLDFHTSEKIPGVGEQFDADDFARTAKEAFVNSMTVFARCHHGYLYYDSRKFPELVHPNLQRKNLLLNQIDALHREGIKAPVYITVQWDYLAANQHPEWLIRKQDGSHEGESFLKAGFYQSLCVNTGYQDYLMEITRDVLGTVGDRLDGVFFDIVGIRPCWCSKCRQLMREKNIDLEDETQVRRFASDTMTRFKKEMTELVRTYSSDCSIFYNAGHVGPALKSSADSFTHFELESLPSGSWGYQHFPVTARYARNLGKDCLGMTGKFHTAWGDFHSLKNPAALEYECFRMLSFGFGCSIGDQLEPNGRLNPATYRLIGDVYKKVAEREAFSRPAEPVVEAAIVTSESDLIEHTMPEDVMGAAQLMEEICIQCDIIDPEMDFSKYRLIVLPDMTFADEICQRKIEEYVRNGGRVLACFNGGRSQEGRYPDSFGVGFEGLLEKYPDFVVPGGILAEGLEADTEYVMYQQGNLLRAATAEIVLYANDPYFKREGENFCSHLYTPSSKEGKHPAAFRNGNVIVCAHPLFSQYRENAPLWCKILIKNAVYELLSKPLIAHDGPSTVSMQLLKQEKEKRYCLHMLSYIPVRKNRTIDIIEERTKVYNIRIAFCLEEKIQKAKLQPENVELEIKGDSIVVPQCDGYQIVELSYI